MFLSIRSCPQIRPMYTVTLLMLTIFIMYQTFDYTTRCSKTISSHHEKSDPSDKRCFLRKHCMKYLHKPTNVCTENPMLFIFVFSLASSTFRRTLLRETWANREVFKAADVEIVFLIGRERADNRTDQAEPLPAELYAEALTHNDIYIIDLMESFYNLTVKAVFGLHAATELCPRARFVMKTDDDVVVNMPALLKYLAELGQVRGVVIGRIWRRGHVLREGKYRISKEVYGGNTYGPFCSGSGWMMSMDVAQVLYALAMYERRDQVVHLDDPYITGILASRAGVTHLDISEKYGIPVHNIDIITKERQNGKLIFHIGDEFLQSASQRETIHRNLWQKLVN